MCNSFGARRSESDDEAWLSLQHGLPKVISKPDHFVLVSDMVVARLAKFFFKSGEREAGFAELDLVLNKRVRSAKGYRGYVSMFSCEQDEVAIIMTMWQDNESFLSSQELFSSTMEKAKRFFEKDPEVEYYRIDTINLIQ
jgi:quinol monooxygenase YgiN